MVFYNHFRLVLLKKWKTPKNPANTVFSTLPGREAESFQRYLASLYLFSFTLDLNHIIIISRLNYWWAAGCYRGSCISSRSSKIWADTKGTKKEANEVQVISYLLSLSGCKFLFQCSLGSGPNYFNKLSRNYSLFTVVRLVFTLFIEWRWVSPGYKSQSQAKGRGRNAGIGIWVTLTLAQATSYSWSETSHSLGGSVIWEHQVPAHPLFYRIFSPCFGKPFVIWLHVE